MYKKKQEISFSYTERSDQVTEIFLSEREMQRLIGEFELRRRCLGSCSPADEELKRSETSQTYPKCRARVSRTVHFQRETTSSVDHRRFRTGYGPELGERQQQRLPANPLLTAAEYEDYVRARYYGDDGLHGCCFERRDHVGGYRDDEDDDDDDCILKSPSYCRSSTLTHNSTTGGGGGKSSSGTNPVGVAVGGALECHVVGDLLSFASNTMR